MFRGLLNTSQSRRRASSQARPSTPKKPAVTGPSYSILGANTRFVGTLKTEGDVQVEDIFVGDITARGRVTLGKQASLDGDLICEQAVIAGLVKGDVTARRITVLGTGRILGNLRMEKLMTEDGAFIQGVITLEKSLELDEVVQEKARSLILDAAPVREDVTQWPAR
ncbi:MAG TPA: polymer-forming cytoskeletal protein [Aggregatilineales bacterium]|nr:polymer-forming cytoskeletal protein [Chloroflexota bacterium]HQE19988.1 polymer-forming cytoskeletal protein [Aggregatilineales bacterium]